MQLLEASGLAFTLEEAKTEVHRVIERKNFTILRPVLDTVQMEFPDLEYNLYVAGNNERVRINSLKIELSIRLSNGAIRITQGLTSNLKGVTTNFDLNDPNSIEELTETIKTIVRYDTDLREGAPEI